MTLVEELPLTGGDKRGKDRKVHKRFCRCRDTAGQTRAYVNPTCKLQPISPCPTLCDSGGRTRNKNRVDILARAVSLLLRFHQPCPPLPPPLRPQRLRQLRSGGGPVRVTQFPCLGLYRRHRPLAQSLAKPQHHAMISVGSCSVPTQLDHDRKRPGRANQGD